MNQGLKPVPVPALIRRHEPARVSLYAVALRRMTPLLAFAVAPVLFFAVAVYALIGNGFAIDFHGQFWPAGRRVLEGLSPYDIGWMDIQRDVAFPYGAIPALLFAPFALLPIELADAVFVGLCVFAVPLTLHLLGVRDWRIYGIVFLWQPVLSAWATANVTLLLGLGLALIWRHRRRAFVVGLLFALLVSIKMFLWPLGIWLLGSRRYAAIGYAALCGLVLNILAWMVLGFDQLGAYVKVLGLVTDREESRSYSLLALALDHGAGRFSAYALTIGLAAILGGACFVLARRGRESAALLLCVAMSFVATPVTWAHYFALLIVPLALLRPRLSPVWAIPIVLALVPGVAPENWQLVLALLTVAIVVVCGLRSVPAERSGSRPELA